MEKEINIFWTDKAKSDLRQIFDYFATEVTEEKAQVIVQSILVRTKQLQANPYSGAIEPYLLHLKFKYRRLI
jgi:plasmid stabilization system protein ParE